MKSRPQPGGVAILASTLVTGGAERVIEALASGLGARGYPGSVLCLHAPGEVGEAIARRGVPVASGFARSRLDPAAGPRLARRLREARPAALLVLDHHDAIFLGALAGRGAGIRHRLLAVHSTGLWGKRSSFSVSDRFVLGSYERVIALATAHARYLAGRERIAPEKIATIPNGVDAERFRPPDSVEAKARSRAGLGVPDGAFVVTIVAALRPEKNHAMLLDAASRVSRGGRRFLFLVAGEGKEREALERKAAALSLGDAVRFLGRREDIPDILAASDAAVLCSFPVVETFPLAVLEAMACGLCVVATDVGAVREMLADGEEGILIPSGDADALARSLEGLAARPAERSRIGANARARVVREFTVGAMVDRYAALLDSLLGRSR